MPTFTQNKSKFSKILDLYIAQSDKFSPSEINDLNDLFGMGMELFEVKRTLPKSHTAGAQCAITNKTTVETPQRSIPAAYAIMDLDDLITSHTPPTFKPDPRYPDKCQQRDYEGDKAEQEKVRVGALHFNPRIVINNAPTASDGAAIVNKKGFVLGGNGRTMMMKSLGNDKYQEYVAKLRCDIGIFGLSERDIDKHKKPVLVRIVSMEVNECALFSNILNQNLTQELDLVTKTVSFARQLSPADVSNIAKIFEDADSDTLASMLGDRKVVKKLQEVFRGAGIITPQNTSKWLKDGDVFTQEGRIATEGILVGTVLDDKDLIESARSFTEKIVRTIPLLLRMKRLPKKWNLIDDIQTVIRLEYERRQTGDTIDDFIAQISFAKPEVQEKEELIWRILSENSWLKWKNFLERYVKMGEDAVESESTGGGFFGETLEPMDAIRRLAKKQTGLSGYDDDKTRFESILDLYISNASKFTASEINELNEVFELGKELFGSERELPAAKNLTYTNHYAFHKAITEKKNLLPIDHFLFYKSAAKEQKTDENPQYDHIDYPEQFSLEWIKKVNKSLINNRLSINDFKKAFAYVRQRKSQIQVLLSSYSKDALLSLLGATGAYSYKNEKKDRVIDAVYNSIEKTFQLGSITYSFGENIHDVLAKKVEKNTQADLEEYAQEVQESIASYKKYIEKSKKSLTNPETIEEFEYFLSVKPKSELTKEQLRRYDELLSAKILERREIEFTKKAEIKKVENVSEMKLIETVHTKYNYPLYVVQLQGRVEKDTYNELNSSAKKLGGWYSSFRGSGAVPGFQFKDKAQAEKFMALREGDITNIERKEEIKTEKTEARADKLRATAESMIAKADQELGKERLTNTYRRANMANNADSKALNQKRLAQTMLNIADAIDSGKAKYLNYISTTTQIELLESIVRDATRREHSEKYKDAYERRKHENDTATIETADYIGIGYYPSIYVETIRELIRTIGNKSGGKLLAQRWTRKLQDYSREQRYQVKSDEEMSELKRMVELLSPSELKYSRIHEIMLQFARLKAMKIDNDSMLREVVREFIMYRAGKSEQSKVTMLERSLAGKSNVGIDYFPTPKELAERMVEMADIQPGMSVLEPSAGNGNIADAIKNAGVIPDVIELSSTLKEILEAKGYPIVGTDFMEFDSKKYDRIVMNPPFGNSQDAQHIMHAYSLLKPGGRIVAIAGEGIFFRKDKKSVEFQEFMDEKNGVVEKLPEKTFTDKKLYSTTGANARLLVLDKREERKNNSLSDNMKKQESSPTYPTIPQAVADEIGQAFTRAGQMDFVRLMKNPAVANTVIQLLKQHGIINSGNQSAWMIDSTTLTENGITILRESLWKTIFPNLGTSDFPIQVSDKVLKNLSSFLKIRQNPRIFGQFEIAVQIGNEFAGNDDTVMFDDPLDAQEFAFLCPFLYDTKNDKFEWVLKKYLDWNGKTDRKEFLDSLSGEIGHKKQRQSTFGLSDQYVWR
mgnify:CR=1 FL=1